MVMCFVGIVAVGVAWDILYLGGRDWCPARALYFEMWKKNVIYGQVDTTFLCIYRRYYTCTD